MTKQECLMAIQAFGRTELLALWERIKRRATEDSGWQRGLAFEYLILQAFRLEGADVIWSFPVNLFGAPIEQIDGVVHMANSHLSLLVESKDVEQAVSVEPIAKMRNQLQRRPNGVIGSVFSVNGFTEPALTLAQFIAPQTILLWDQQDINYCLQHGTFTDGLLKKYRHCIEYGKPNYNLTPLEDIRYEL